MFRTHAEIQADIDEATTKVANIKQQIDVIERSAGEGDLSAGQVQKVDRLLAGFDKAKAEREAFRTELRELIRSNFDSGAMESGDGAAPVRRSADTKRRGDNVISRALRCLDDNGKHLSAGAGGQVDTLLRADRSEVYEPDYIAERLLITETDAYRSGWMRVLQAGQHNMPAMLTGPESDALRAFQELERRHADVSRAMNEGTNSAGLYGVPVLIDPSIIVTSGAADVPILRVCRIEQVTTNIWKGVSASGMSWSYDDEASQVSDDSPTLAQPTVTVFMPRGFIPYSLEIGMDYPNFASEMSRLLNQGYTDLLAGQLVTGFGGTTSPRGIFTALDANTNVEVVTTTDGQFGGPDVFKVWNALPERYRGRATWVMSVHVESAIRQFAATTGSASAYFTVDLTADGVSRINGRPVIVTDYAPTFATTVPGTTGAANILAVGAFDNYLYANRAGMSVESVPHLVGANNRPTGQRGLFAYARHGADSVNDKGFRLLQNQ